MPRNGTIAPHIPLDRASHVPLRRQLSDGLIAAIRAGELVPGGVLPSTRALAAHLRVARSTVVSCYLELEGEGWVRTVPGGGTYVSQRALTRAAEGSQPHYSELSKSVSCDLRYNFVPGYVDPTLLTSRAWRAAWMQELTSERVSPPSGEPELLSELARHLASARGMQTTSTDLIICGGLTEALLLLGLGLGWQGRTVVVEDPCWPQVPLTLARLGAVVQSVEASDPDAMLDALTTSHPTPAAAYLTPNNQYPLGHSLDARQRERLLGWARSSGCVIIEDDYDSEYRFQGPSPDALAAAEPAGNVIYFGTISKMLDPGLRVAYLRCPPSLRPILTRARRDLGTMTARAPQLVVARLLRSGEVSRHTARLRRIYGDRRAAMVRSLGTVPGVQRTSAGAGGLQIVATLRPGVESGHVVEQAAQEGLALVDLASFYIRSRSANNALVLNYARHNPSDIRAAITLLSTLPAMRLPYI